MTNTQRNTTVLAVLLSIIATVGFIAVYKLTKESKVYFDKNTKLNAEIYKYNKLIDMKPKLEQDFAELRLMLANQSKVIAQVDNPASTYRYLLNLLDWINKNIIFDFAMSAASNEGVQYNEYVLSGKADYRDISTFVKNVEYQRALLTIEDVSLAQDPTVMSDSVMFSIVFRTHYSLDGTPLENISRKDVASIGSNFSAFRPRVYETPPDLDIDPDLVRVDKSYIVGITESRVFIRDDLGIIRILAVGDPVAYGYLYSIDPGKEKAVFKLNQYGLTEDKTLYIPK
jgi:hypothetical protein